MKIGYARVSTDTQTTQQQEQALAAAGCEKVFVETASGGKWDRPELQRLLDQLRKGDVLVVWKLDRLSRSLKDLLIILERLQSLGVGFLSLTEAIDTTSPAGRMMMQLLGAFAEFERGMIKERTSAGLARARAEGRVGGRPSKLSPQQRQEVLRSLANGEKSAAELARLFNVSASAISRLQKSSLSTSGQFLAAERCRTNI
jgi:DNA invertase Pin-like site-specific DNA recombinase